MFNPSFWYFEIVFIALKIENCCSKCLAFASIAIMYNNSCIRLSFVQEIIALASFSWY